MDKSVKSLISYISFINVGMSVLMRSKRIHAVIEMHSFQLVYADDAAKFSKHAFEVFLDCIAMDDGLVQYLIDVLKRMDRAEFFKLSQITTKLDLDPEEFLYWLAHRQDYAGEEEQACAAVMDAVLLRLAEEGRLDVVAALLSGDQKTFETFRCEAPELVHLPQATYDWYCRNYLDRDYPFRMLLKCNGVTFPRRKEG